MALGSGTINSKKSIGNVAAFIQRFPAPRIQGLHHDDKAQYQGGQPRGVLDPSTADERSARHCQPEK